MLVRIVRLVMPFLFIIPLVAGCEETPVEQYTSTLMEAKNKAHEAADEATLSAMRATIKNYRAMNGKNPPDLKEISGMMGTELDPGRYYYDPASGEVRMKSVP
jgi:hypothetical protein